MPWLWRINQITNVLAALAASAVLCWLVVSIATATDDPYADPHGYFAIFTAVVAGAVLALIALLIAGAVLLHRRKLSGPLCQLAAGMLVTLAGFAEVATTWPAITVGVLMMAFAMPLIVTWKAPRTS